MISPFKDEDKQVLLETQDLQDFYRKLLSIIDLELVEILTIKPLINPHSKITNHIFNFFVFIYIIKT